MPVVQPRFLNRVAACVPSARALSTVVARSSYRCPSAPSDQEDGAATSCQFSLAVQPPPGKDQQARSRRLDGQADPSGHPHHLRGQQQRRQPPPSKAPPVIIDRAVDGSGDHTSCAHQRAPAIAWRQRTSRLHRLNGMRAGHHLGARNRLIHHWPRPGLKKSFTSQG